jgi:hypothetical protein
MPDHGHGHRTTVQQLDRNGLAGRSEGLYHTRAQPIAESGGGAAGAVDQDWQHARHDIRHNAPRVDSVPGP